MKTEDITGKKFNLLTVIKKVPDADVRSNTWICQCECGKYITATYGQLVNGRKKSCGAVMHRAPRVIDITSQRFGRLVAIQKEGATTSGDVVWLCQCDCGNRVVVSSYSLRNHVTKSCGCLRRDIGRDLFKHDDRFLSNQGDSHHLSDENGVSFASTKIGTRNTSGVIGVSWDKQSEKWNARLYYKGRYVLLKAFGHFNEAVAARKEAESKYLKGEAANEKHG